MKRLTAPAVSLALGLVLVLAAGCAPKKPAAAGPAASAVPALLPAEASPLFQAVGMQIPKSEMAAEDFTLELLDGKPVTLSDYRGKVVFLNFWATWCPPCRSEMPAMQALYERLKGRGLVILAIDLAEKPDVVRQYIRSNKLTFPVLLDSSGEVGGAWGAESIPTTYIIDKGGKIIARGVGAQWKWDSPEIVALFERLL
jgi:peroxiredoxin